MKLPHIIARLCLCSTSASAFLWSPRQAKQESQERDQRIGSSQNIPFSKEELDVMQRNIGVLERYSESESPDCFRIAARNIRSRCMESDMDKEERVTTAISMTLCEIATGSQYSIPMECQSFYSYPSTSTSRSSTKVEVSSFYSSYQKPRSPKQNNSKASQCVDALSRSAQFWSSYSGYLREMPQLCYAFRRWNEIDLAKDLYRNITLEKISFIRLLFDREKSMNIMIDMWRDDVEDTVTQLRQVTDIFNYQSTALSGELKESLYKITNEFRNEIIEWFQIQQESQEQNYLTVARQFESMMLVQEEQTEHMKKGITLYHQVLQQEIDSIITTTSGGFGQILEEMNLGWREMGRYMDETRLVFSGIMEDGYKLAIDMQALHLEADALQNKQSSTLLQLSDLSTLTSELVGTTRTGLEELNVTLIILKDDMALAGKSGEWQMWNSGVMWVLEKLLQLDSGAAKKLVQVPLFHGLNAGVSFLITVLRIGVSVFLSTAVVVHLGSRHLMNRLVGLFADTKGRGTMCTTSCGRSIRSGSETIISADGEELQRNRLYPNRCLHMGCGRIRPAKVGTIARSGVSRIPERLWQK